MDAYLSAAALVSPRCAIRRYSEFPLYIAGERDGEEKTQRDISHLPLFLACYRFACHGPV